MVIRTSFSLNPGSVKNICRNIACLIAATFIAAPAWADDVLTPVSALNERWGQPQYNGTRFPALKVSGAALGELVNVIIPAELAGRDVCLTVNAANDWYTAHQTFRVADDWPGGLAGATLASSYDSAPRNIYQVAANAGLTRFSLGECDRIGHDLTLLLSAWRKVPRGGVTSIYVLAQRGERVAAALDDHKAEVACALDAETSGRYTHRCDFDSTLFEPGSHGVTVYVFSTRTVGGQLRDMLEWTDSLTILAGPGIAP